MKSSLEILRTCSKNVLNLDIVAHYGSFTRLHGRLQLGWKKIQWNYALFLDIGAYLHQQIPNQTILTRGNVLMFNWFVYMLCPLKANFECRVQIHQFARSRFKESDLLCCNFCGNNLAKITVKRNIFWYIPLTISKLISWRL